MNTSVFIKKNLDILLISIESLDPYILEKISVYADTLSLIEIFLIRNNNCIRYKDKAPFIEDWKILTILQKISKVYSTAKVQRNLSIILKEYIYFNNSISSKQVEIYNYLKRFQANYRKSMKPYLLGKLNYDCSTSISNIGLVNLFILYKINSYEGTYILLLYLIIKTIIVQRYIPKK